MAGSLQPVVQVDAWYGGELVAERLQVPSGTVSFDATRLVCGSASLVVVSPDGLPPVTADGTELHVRAGFNLPTGVEMVSLGWLRVDSAVAAEQWQAYRAPVSTTAALAYDGGTAASTGSGAVSDTGTTPIIDGGSAAGTSTAQATPPAPVWAPRGAQLQVQCSDRMSNVDDAQFLTPTQPASLTSVLAEVRNLCRDIVPVGDLSAVTDAAIPKAITYQSSRSQALTDLAASLGMTPRVDSDGALMLAPINPAGAAVWTLAVDSDSLPALVDWSRKFDRAGLYNAVVVQGTDPQGNPLQGFAVETVGPFAYGGAFGRVPYFHSDPLATTQAAVDATAATMLQTLVRQRAVTIPVTCPPNYALEVGDMVSLTLPDRTLTGAVVTVDITLGAATMTVGVAIPRDQLA